MKKDNFLQFLGICKRAGKLVEGYNKCEQIIKSKKLYLIILSNDISENSIKKFENYCFKYNITLIQGYSQNELGLILGRKEISIIGVLDKKLSENLICLAKQNTNILFGGEEFVKN